MGIIGDIANRVKSDLTWKAGQEVSGGITSGASKLFKKGDKGANKCPKCKKPIAEGLKFCTECGAKLTKTCEKCKADFPINTKFCPQCGGPLK